jgi:5-formyltetrahydrofolate cyclo-ligase
MVTQPAPMSPPPPIPAEIARRLGLQARRFLSEAERSELSGQVVQRLLELDEVRQARRLAGYAALADEVRLAGLFEELDRRGTQLALPRVSGEGLEFATWSPGDDLATGRFGVGEPTGGTVALPSLDVVVVPCVAVDDRGTRVGFGAGFYDRTLGAGSDEQAAGDGGDPQAGGSGPVVVGVAFEVQCLGVIERRGWDVPLDVVVTDDRIIRAG